MEIHLEGKSQLWPEKWILHHDNAPALRVCEILAKKSIIKMDHPPYSPDLSPEIFSSLQN
jgi:hypothetical protein